MKRCTGWDLIIIIIILSFIINNERHELCDHDCVTWNDYSYFSLNKKETELEKIRIRVNNAFYADGIVCVYLSVLIYLVFVFGSRSRVMTSSSRWNWVQNRWWYIHTEVACLSVCLFVVREAFMKKCSHSDMWSIFHLIGTFHRKHFASIENNWYWETFQSVNGNWWWKINT